MPRPNLMPLPELLRRLAARIESGEWTSAQTPDELRIRAAELEGH